MFVILICYIIYKFHYLNFYECLMTFEALSRLSISKQCFIFVSGNEINKLPLFCKLYTLYLPVSFLVLIFILLFIATSK